MREAADDPRVMEEEERKVTDGVAADGRLDTTVHYTLQYTVHYTVNYCTLNCTLHCPLHCTVLYGSVQCCTV